MKVKPKELHFANPTGATTNCVTIDANQTSAKSRSNSRSNPMKDKSSSKNTCRIRFGKISKKKADPSSEIIPVQLHDDVTTAGIHPNRKRSKTKIDLNKMKLFTMTEAEKHQLISQRLCHVFEDCEMGSVRLDNEVPYEFEIHSQNLNSRLLSLVKKDCPLWGKSKGSSEGSPTYFSSESNYNSKACLTFTKAHMEVDSKLVEDSSKIKINSPTRQCFPRSNSQPTISPSCSNANYSPETSPMLNYSTIDTPILKSELKRFGLKPFARSKAKVILRHIYDETHKK